MKAAAVRVVPIPRTLRSDLLRRYTAALASRTAASRPSVVRSRRYASSNCSTAMRGGNLTAEMTPHPVGHGCQVARCQSDVLVCDPQITGVGRCRHPQPAHRATSRIVLPTFTRSPRRSRVGTSRRSSFKKVPFVEPRSSIQSSPLRLKTRAWIEEANVSSSRGTAQPGERPTVTSSPSSKRARAFEEDRRREGAGPGTCRQPPEPTQQPAVARSTNAVPPPRPCGRRRRKRADRGEQGVPQEL